MRASQESLSHARQVLAAREQRPQSAGRMLENSQLASNRIHPTPQNTYPRLPGGGPTAAPPGKLNSPAAGHSSRRGTTAQLQSSRSEQVAPHAL